MLLRNRLFLVIILIVLLSSCKQKVLQKQNYFDYGSIESTGLQESPYSIDSYNVAVIDVVPSEKSIALLNKIELYDSPMSLSRTHSDEIISIISKYCPKNTNIDLYSVGNDDIKLDILKKALKDISEKTYDVVNMSFVLSQSNEEIKELLGLIENNGTILIGSAGNHKLPFAEYPSGYDSVISIGGINEYGLLWENSNFKRIDYVMPVKDKNNKEVGTSISSAYMSSFIVQMYIKHPKLKYKNVADLKKEINEHYLISDINELMGNGQPTLIKEENLK